MGRGSYTPILEQNLIRGETPLMRGILPHNTDYVVFSFFIGSALLSDHQSQPINFAAVFVAAGHDVDSGSVDTSVP